MGAPSRPLKASVITKARLSIVRLFVITEAKVSLGNLLAKVPLGKQLVKVPLGKQLVEVPLGKQLVKVPLGKQLVQVPLGKQLVLTSCSGVLLDTEPYRISEVDWLTGVPFCSFHGPVYNTR